MATRLSFATHLRLTGSSILLAALTLPPCAAAQTERKAETSREQRESEKQKKKQDDGVGFRWKGYPSFEFGKGTHVDLRARVQFDVQQFDSPSSEGDSAESDLARRRVAIEGAIGNVVAFEVDAELESDNKWRDVYANYQQFSYAQVQAGQFKLPFSMDENTSATNLDLVYRSLAARVLAPGRDRGGMVHGRRFDRIVK
jgi:phosphate-selective porin